MEGIRQKVRLHLELAQWLASEIRQSADFELLAPVDFSLVCFRYLPSGITDEASINEINEQLLQTLNAGGKLYMTHTKLNGKYTLRMVIAQTYVEKHHVENAWKLIRETAGKI